MTTPVDSHHVHVYFDGDTLSVAHHLHQELDDLRALLRGRQGPQLAWCSLFLRAGRPRNPTSIEQ